MRLTDAERKICKETIDRLTGSSQAAHRARILLQVDAVGPSSTDRRIADAFRCLLETVEDVRRRCALERCELALCDKQHSSPAFRDKAGLAGEQRAAHPLPNAMPVTCGSLRCA